MLIPGNPVRQRCTKGESIRQDILFRPFQFLSEKQVIFSCGREALYFGINLLGYLPKSAHVPAYCCQSVLASFKKSGIKVKFYDVGKHLEPIIDESFLNKGDIFLLIHYFGIAQDAQSIKSLCDRYHVVLVEDCAHTLPDPKSKHPIGSIGAFSIYSLRKQLPVPDGGVLVINEEPLKNRLEVIPKPKLRSISTKKWMVMTIDRLAFFLGWPNTLKIKDALRDKIGSTDSVFYSRLSNNPMPEICYTTAKILSNVDIGEIARIRRKNYFWLVDKLNDIAGITIPFPNLPDGAVPQALPILVKDARTICIAMRKKGIGVDQWPANEFPDIGERQFPCAHYWNNHLLLLPIHQDLSIEHLEFCVKTLGKIYEKK